MFKFKTTYQTDVWINPATVMMLEPHSSNRMHTTIYMIDGNMVSVALEPEQVAWRFNNERLTKDGTLLQSLKHSAS